MQYSAVQCSALHCSALQCIVVQCNEVQFSAVQYHGPMDGYGSSLGAKQTKSPFPAWRKDLTVLVGEGVGEGVNRGRCIYRKQRTLKTSKHFYRR